MGCCFSCSRGPRPNSPYPGAAAQYSSARAINPPVNPPQSQQIHSPHPAASSDAGGSPSDQRRGRRNPRPLDQHINKPLRRHVWTSKNRLWSRSTLDRERTEFFDTRVTGRPEIWQTLKAALDVIWESDVAASHPPDTIDGGHAEGDADEHNPAIALATAQSILDAADITLPTGNLRNGAYDALGNYYQLPAHIVSDPVNIVPDGQDEHGLGEIKADLTGGDDTAGESEELDDDEARRRREEKGKAVVDVRSQVLAVIRLSETSRDLRLHVGKDETVRSIIRRILEETSDYRIRLIYMGKILKENASLMAQGWQPGQVLNAFMHEPLS